MARWTTVRDYLADGLAAEGTQPITFGTMSATLRIFQGVPARRDHLGKMLAKVAQDCAAKGEPDLTAFVVYKRTGLPGTGYTGGDPELERKKAHELHRVRVWGK